MRCPKCGYISFDTSGSCKKCKKNIGRLVEELEGTVFGSRAPLFLHIEPGTSLTRAEEDSEDDTTAGEMEAGPEFSPIVEEEPAEITIDDEAEPDETIAFEDFEEVETETTNEVILEEETENEAETEGDDLQLDFGDIDISDLGPPETDTTEQDSPETDTEVTATESLTLEEDGIETGAEMEPDATPVPSSVASGSGLEDLQVDNLDLDSPAPLVSGSKVGGKLMPSVKTGTALDDFDIDLGELITEEK